MLSAINREEASILKEYYNYINACLFCSTLQECAGCLNSVNACTLKQQAKVFARYRIQKNKSSSNRFC
jgi:hypothetical protein